MRLARWAYNLGWGPKGWPAGNPLAGVPYWVQQSLLTMACADGLPLNWVTEEGFSVAVPIGDLRSRLSPWQQADYGQAPGLDPMCIEPQHAADRLLSVLLERALESPGDLRAEGPGVWIIGNEEIAVPLQALLSARIPRRLRAVARRSGRPRERGAEWERWVTIAPASIRLWATAWLHKLERHIEEGTSELRIRIHTDEILPIISLWDSLELLEAIRRLYGLSFRLPDIRIHAPGLSESGRSALDAYLGRTNGHIGREALWPLVEGPVENPQIVIGDPVCLKDDELTSHWDEEDIAGDAEQLLNEGHLGLPQDYEIKDSSHELLDHFFSRFLGHPSLRKEQVEAIQRLLNQESLLILMPTGYGKSAIYQLSALIQPGIALVISPLVALIQDQVGHLRRNGIIGVESITSRGGQSPREVYQRLEQGSIRLFYVTPERLVTQGFQRFVEEMMGFRRFSFIAVDEAHCASEWGHDFRPSYKFIKVIREDIERESGGDGRLRTPIVGLTATASETVRDDVLHILGIGKDNVIQSRSSDRPELSYSVHLAGGHGYQERLGLLEEILSRTGFEVLKLDNGLLDRTESGEYRHGAVVFAPFADPTSEPLVHSAAPAIGYYLARHGWSPDAIGVYSSTAPRWCPHCDSPRIFRQRRGGIGEPNIWRCIDCERESPERKLRNDQKEWGNQLIQTQEAFLDSRMPLLVSTKGFGMGVDKPNIRLIVHYVMSGSLEGYYQEVGRAGRDGRHAHVALISVPPGKECAETYIDNGRLWNLQAHERIRLPCLKGYGFSDCICNLTDPCDVAQQAILINLTFRGVEEEEEALNHVYAWLQAGWNEIPAKGFIDHYRGYRNKDYTVIDIEKALVALRELSVLRGHIRRGDGASFALRRMEDWSWEKACDVLEEHIEFYERLAGGGGPHSLPRQQIRKRRDEPGTQECFVRWAGRLLLETRYNTIRATRLQSLYNLYRYTTLPEGRCRRAFLRQTFEINPPAEYQCGFCDTCVPSLSF
ncbi:MAG: DEAD/DEAH box helicase, partial [Limnochordia bacterium]